MRRNPILLQRGVTLIELMVALILLGILAAFTAPAFSGALERSRTRGAVDQVVSMINNSRQYAVKQDRDVNLTFRGAASAWCVGARASADPAAGVSVGTAAA